MDDSQAKHGPPQDSTSPPGARSPNEKPLSLSDGQSPTAEPSHSDLFRGVDPQTFQDLILKAIKDIPDIRQDQINRIREALQSGNYHIPSDQVAGRIIRDILQDKSLNQE